MYTRTKRLDSITTLRGTAPSAEAENFINFKIDTKRIALEPKRLGTADHGFEVARDATNHRYADKL